MTGNTYTTDTGIRLINVHDENESCHREGCAIHNPTSSNSHLPTHWLIDERTPQGRIVRLNEDKIEEDEDVQRFLMRGGW